MNNSVGDFALVDQSNLSSNKLNRCYDMNWQEVITTDCVYKDGKYRQMALIGFGTQTTEFEVKSLLVSPSQTKTMQNIIWWPWLILYINLRSSSKF